MASPNLDLVRSILAAWERGDFSRAAEWADSEIEFVIPDGPSPGSWRGLARMEDGWRDFLGAWQDMRQDTDGYRELDQERILVLTRLNARGNTSGVNIGQASTRQAGLFHVRDGKVTRLVYYLDRDRALADLGLAEWAMSQECTTPDLVELARRYFTAVNRRDFDVAAWLRHRPKRRSGREAGTAEAPRS